MVQAEASNLFIFQSQSVKLTYAHTKKGLNGFSKPPKQNKIYAHPLFPRLIKKKKNNKNLHHLSACTFKAE